MTIICLTLINAVAYLLMCLDKWKAKKGLGRISEKTLFVIALCFGATGIYLGMMQPISHKSSKLTFKIGIPICLGFNALSFYLMEKYVLDISM